MSIQMMSNTVECMLLVPKLRIHMHSINVRADIFQIVDVNVLNHHRHCLTFCNFSNAHYIQAVIVFIDRLVAYILIG
jgi:hypothetical protein